MLKIDIDTGESTVKGTFTNIMGELTTLINHIAEEAIEAGAFKDKFEMLDKIRESIHYADMIEAGITAEEAFRASTGRDMNERQKEKAHEIEKETEKYKTEKG